MHAVDLLAVLACGELEPFKRDRERVWRLLWEGKRVWELDPGDESVEFDHGDVAADGYHSPEVASSHGLAAFVDVALFHFDAISNIGCTHGRLTLRWTPRNTSSASPGSSRSAWLSTAADEHDKHTAAIQAGLEETPTA